MTIRNLDAIFKAKSVALIGGSPVKTTVGGVIVENLQRSGFSGTIFYVNPKYPEIDGHKCYPDLRSLPFFPDLAVIATPPQVIPGIIEALGAGGTRGAIVITAGYAEQDGERNRLWKEAMLIAARPQLLRLIGPNCLGVMVPKTGLNASFGPTSPLSGGLAFVAQSGAVLTSVLDWATSRDIGFTHFISLGDMLDVDFGDMLDYLAQDGATRAILLYIEAVTSTRKFMSAARAAARLKPVIVVKAGRYAEGARAAATHSGALAGEDAVYAAAFRRAGMLRVMDMEALFNAVETLALGKQVLGNRLAILTNGGGVGVMATDTLIEKMGRLAELSAETLTRLNNKLPHNWSHTNPVDIIGDADGDRYGNAMTVLLEDRNIDGILVMNCPTAISSSTEAARAVIEAVKNTPNKYRRPAVLAVWLGDGSAREGRQLLRKNGIPCYETPGEGVRGFMQMVRYQHNREMLLQTVSDLPEAFSPDVLLARQVVQAALDDGREWLNGDEVQNIFSAYEIPVVPTYKVRNEEEAAAVAGEISGNVALKIVASGITHKSEVGGVALYLESPEEVRKAGHRMLQRVAKACPDADIHGFLVQQMASSPHRRELIVGAFEDAAFGPVIVFGEGGVAVEVIRDKGVALPPLNMNLAHDLIGSTRISALLDGYRNVPPVDKNALALTLVKISQLVCDIGEIKELDINPLLASEEGVVAVDARIRVAWSKVEAADRLAICPYPRELEQMLTLADGQKFLIRPVKPEDEAGFVKLFDRLSPEEIHMRFLHPMRVLSHELAARLTQIDYDREMALVLEGEAKEGGRELLGGVRISGDPDKTEAEFAILLRRQVTGIGLGPLLLRIIINYARQKGFTRLFGEVLVENSQMLKLARALGFSVKPLPGDASLRLVELDL